MADTDLCNEEENHQEIEVDIVEIECQEIEVDIVEIECQEIKVEIQSETEHDEEEEFAKAPIAPSGILIDDISGIKDIAKIFCFFSSHPELLFVIGLVIAHGFAKTAVLSVIINYVTEHLQKKDLATEAIIVNIREGVLAVIILIVARIVDKCGGHLKMVFFTTFLYIIGLVLLRFVPVEKNLVVNPIFLSSMLLTSVGQAGEYPFVEFLALLLPETKKDDLYTKIWAVGQLLGAIVASLVWAINNIKWNTILIITTITMGAAFLWFFLEISTSDSIKGKIKCKCIDECPSVSESTGAQGKNAMLLLIPLWTSFLTFSLVNASRQTFFLNQNTNLHPSSIPVNIFNIFSSIATMLVQALLHYCISKIDDSKKKRHKGLGGICFAMAFAFLSCISAWQVEVHRLKLVKHNHLQDDEKSTIHMSIFWLTPQFVFHGLMTGLAESGLDHFLGASNLNYVKQFRYSVTAFGSFLSALLVFVCKNWFHDSINHSHVDKYYLLLVILTYSSLVIFLVVFYRSMLIEPPTPKYPAAYIEEVPPYRGIRSGGINSINFAI